MSQLTNDQVVTVAQNIESVKGNAANMAAILAVWTAMSAIKLAPGAAYAAGLSESACEVIQKRCEEILDNVQSVVDVVPATPIKLGVCRGDQTTISTMNGILSLMSHHVSHEPGGSDVITSLGPVSEKSQDLGTISGSVTIDLSTGLSVSATIGGATTLAFTSVPSGGAAVVVLRITNGGSAAVTWPTTISWVNSGAPRLTAAGTNMIVLVTDDEGASWIGSAGPRYGAGA